MTPGRKPKPRALKLVTGNPGRRKIPAAPEVAEAPDDTPDCPVPLQPNALAEWRRVYQPLKQAGIIKGADLTTLGLYCQAAGRAIDSAKTIKAVAETTGTDGLLITNSQGQPMENPAIGTLRRAAHDAMRFGSEFGLTPSSRSRLGIKDDEDMTNLDKYLTKANQ